LKTSHDTFLRVADHTSGVLQRTLVVRAFLGKVAVPGIVKNGR